jgi:hypothetical protein
MRYEVIEDQDEWIVRREGCELARFGDQDTALNDVAARLKEADGPGPARLSVRYQTRTA